MLHSALEINCKSPVRTFLAILRTPLWSSSAANCSPFATQWCPRHKQLPATWLCESIFFKARPQSCGQAVNTNTFLWAHFWGIWALGLDGLKQLIVSLDVHLELCGERGREQALPHCVALGWSRIDLSICSQLRAGASLHFLRPLHVNWFYWRSVLIRNLCRVKACFLNQPKGGMAYILPVLFSPSCLLSFPVCVRNRALYSEQQQL